ncbi:MAG TPA: outer membrane lipoprotein chaperone LolA [Rubrivivax sp.]|nr:outer membrane lipoprotein chaperone LolA [Burkholderiales bacterium]HNT37746.1 outer membrane lipoprotein chaperone LolA [Rubrivivax sp.]
MIRTLMAGALALALCLPARADAVDTLRAFVRDVSSGRAEFTQTVTAVDGLRQKRSRGNFEFLRPNRFRFVYAAPFEQTLVADGSKVWIYDADLNQASSRKLAQALSGTPAALLAGGDLERDFALQAESSQGGLDWVLATPRTADTGFKSVRVGFKGAEPAAIEIVDSFGQRSRLDFSGFVANVPLAPESFRFVPPPGADLIEQ